MIVEHFPGSKTDVVEENAECLVSSRMEAKVLVMTATNTIISGVSLDLTRWNQEALTVDQPEV